MTQVFHGSSQPCSGQQSSAVYEFFLYFFITNVLVQAVTTEYHRLSSVHKKNLVLVVLEAGSPEARGFSSWFIDDGCLVVSSHRVGGVGAEGEEASFLGSFLFKILFINI